jgi:hypothetical protein
MSTRSRRPDRVLVVLDHDHGVAEVAQAQGAEQAFVVALVQADRGFVEHVHHAVRPEPIWLARRMRCASPPESVSAERSSVR